MKNNSEQPVLYFKLFILIVVICAVVSLSFRVITLVADSSFKGQSINVLFIGKNATLVHLDASQNKMYTLSIENGRKYFLGKNRISDSANLGVLVDGVVQMNSEVPLPAFGDLIFSTGNKLNNINQFDLFKMDYYSKLVTSENRKLVRENFSANILGINTSPKNYLDFGILNDEESIAVINASDKAGLAGMVGNALKNVGFNVVKMTSLPNQKSEIVAKNINSESARRLAISLDFPIKQGVLDPSADIAVIIGTDYNK